MIPLKMIFNYLIKTVDGIITPIILLMMKIIFIDSPADVIFGRIRGLLLVPFTKCSSISYIGKNVYFLELLTRKYVFGKKVKVLNSCKFHGPVEIGDSVFFNYNVEVRSHTVIGNNVSIGPNTLIISDTHELGNEKKRAGKGIFKKIIVEDGCWIGANVTILGGVTVGNGSVIAAGSVVTRDVRPQSLVAGIPAKEIRELKG
ncbi:MAG: acyltransferase [Methanosarcina sp.]|jgi:acetyltransferase-like isoleucine patch superfamily enzyme